MYGYIWHTVVSFLYLSPVCCHFLITFQLSNAIKNSLEHNPSGQPYDGPMGVSITITPAHILSSLNKRAITNASFRTRKLPGISLLYMLTFIIISQFNNHI